MMLISERSNKGKEKLIEDGDHNPSQNNLPGSQNFGGGGDLSGRRATESAAVASCSHSAPKKKKRTELLPLSDFIDQINPHRLRWTKELHDHFVRAMKELDRRGEKVTPKTLKNEMGIHGLHQNQVKSRLQAFREGRITEENWKSRKNNKAEIIDGQKSASNGTSTSSREHIRNGPGMGDQNVRGNLETGTVTTPLYSAQQQPQVDVADISAANGGCFMTSNGYSFPGPYNIPTTSAAINNVQVGLQNQTLGFRNNNGFFYPFQPGNGNHWVQLIQYCEASGNIQQGNELARVVQQPAHDGGALGNIQQQNQAEAATDTVQGQNGIYNFRSRNEAHRVQQPAHDGEALGNIQQQNQYFCLEPQAATDTVQVQNATAIMPANTVTAEDQVEDFLNLDSLELGTADFEIVDFDLREPCGFSGLPF